MMQDIVLLTIGVIVLIIGISLYLAKKRGGLVLLALGALWLFAMLVYYVYSTMGFYAAVGLNQSSMGPAVTTTLGFIILIVGIALAVYVARRGGKK
ncbi:hypothetical protein WLZ34_06135 [Thermogladius sp. KZ2Tp1]|uniref:hypothetical protein n=1 Tax=Thermogladius sp. KZ2Tp1 TaxID=3136289 RepID=UPI003DA94FE9